MCSFFTSLILSLLERIYEKYFEHFFHFNRPVDENWVWIRFCFCLNKIYGATCGSPLVIGRSINLATLLPVINFRSIILNENCYYWVNTVLSNSSSFFSKLCLHQLCSSNLLSDYPEISKSRLYYISLQFKIQKFNDGLFLII